MIQIKMFLLNDCCFAELTDLREMLDLFKVNEIKELGKTYKLKTSKKSETIQELIKLGQRQGCLMGNLTDKIIKE
jgi:hypothetical protein